MAQLPQVKSVQIKRSSHQSIQEHLHQVASF